MSPTIPMSPHKLALGQWLTDVINRDRLSVNDVVAILEQAIRSVARKTIEIAGSAFVPVSNNEGLNLWTGTTIFESNAASASVLLQEAIGIVRGMAADMGKNPRLTKAVTV